MKWKIMLILVFSLLLMACSTNEKETSNPKEPEQEAPVEEPVEETEPIIAPLTGLELESEPPNRMLAIMINNHPKARPQTGLSQADIVFEILAEGNITRFMALFHSNLPEKVGPVRSARPYYFNLANDYGALYIYHGAADFIEQMLQNGAADHLNGSYYDNDKVLFERSSDRVAPHNSYVLIDSVYEEAEEKGYEIEGSYSPFSFLSTEEVVEGDPATNVQFDYIGNPIQYIYESTNEKYIRYDGGTETTEKATGEEVEIDNVFILETAHEVVDNAGRREIDLQSGGDALLLQKGKVQHVQWERIDDRIIPTKNGKPVPLVPGKTWINVIPTSPGIDGVEVTSE
ncbi:DUF3048 domain-containing protein [Gracilibacillus dipsosauri]|uniref:DUF3048 domain-containing protein n=1 Tax=Gracilibacillus dipsosauri TaxID=178340 RepID=A0A317KYL5_9BACI|nr:DUF3048 domain-containing protein [Gracilibacillus dipsosauri]PWU66739.1 DUF3048 domain-containing protein [Gracilibacillus dipsosauri]